MDGINDFETLRLGIEILKLAKERLNNDLENLEEYNKLNNIIEDLEKILKNYK